MGTIVCIIAILLIVICFAVDKTYQKEEKREMNRLEHARHCRLAKEQYDDERRSASVQGNVSKKSFITQDEKKTGFTVSSKVEENCELQFNHAALNNEKKTVYDLLKSASNAHLSTQKSDGYDVCIDGESTCSTIINSPIKGTKHIGSVAIGTASKLERGDYLVFEREPDNPYDSNAIKVKTEGGVCIGYVDKLYADIFNRYFEYIEYSIVSKVSKRDRFYLYMDTYLKGEIVEDSVDGYQFGSYFEDLGSMYDKAFNLKYENPQKAVEMFIAIADKKRRVENKIACYHQACMCYRKLNDYTNELDVIRHILKEFKEGLSEERISFFERRLMKVEKLVEKHTK